MGAEQFDWRIILCMYCKVIGFRVLLGIREDQLMFFFEGVDTFIYLLQLLKTIVI